MSVLAVDPVHYEAASQLFGADLAGALAAVYNTLLDDLVDTASMAGSDVPGQWWAVTYQFGADDTVKCIANLQSACMKLATMLQRTGFNHASAENASGGLADQVDTADYAHTLPVGIECKVVPAASGGTGEKPNGVIDLESSQGIDFDWPDGSQGRLRKAARAWRAAARSLSGLDDYVDQAVARIRLQTSPEVYDAITVCSAMTTHFADVASACSGLAAGCEDQASAIDSVHKDTAWFLGQMAVSEELNDLLGGLLTEVTFGLADAVADAANKYEKHNIAKAIQRSIADYGKACRAAMAAMTFMDYIPTVERLIAPILAATLTAAVVEAVPAKNAPLSQQQLLAAETNFIVYADTGRPNIFASGHAIGEHVGRTDADLRSRAYRKSKRKPNGYKRTSTFATFEKAESCTRQNIQNNSEEVRRWLADRTNRANRVIVSPISGDSGRVYDRRTNIFEPASEVITVLRKQGSLYVVLTSYIN